MLGLEIERKKKYLMKLGADVLAACCCLIFSHSIQFNRGKNKKLGAAVLASGLGRLGWEWDLRWV